MCKVWGLSVGKPLIPSNRIPPEIQKRADAVLGAWRDLQDMDRNAATDRFRAMWVSMDLATRVSCLNGMHEACHKVPDAYIYEIARCQESDWKRIDREAFRSPLLGVDDLVRGDNLLCLLDSRLTYHPRVFLHIDGPGVATGLFCGSLPELSCDSRLRLDLTNEDYSFLWDREGFYNPATILYQLEAQYQLYCFLQVCVKLPGRGVDIPRVALKTEEARSQLSCSLIAQLTWTNYVPTGHIDLSFMLNLLDCSLQDTRNDLYDLRLDADLWITRVTARTLARCTATFLMETYDRIDCFNQLKTLVANLLQDDVSCSAARSAAYDNHAGYVALEVALKSTMNEIAFSLRKGVGHSISKIQPLLV